MSKIIIREYDNTKAVGPEYKNFSVVVPGLIDPSKATEFDKVADDNGIFECSSLEDFDTYIGYVGGSSSTVAAEAPNITHMPDGSGGIVLGRAVTAVEYYQTFRGELYYADGAADGIGYLKANIASSGQSENIQKLAKAGLTSSDWDADTVYYHILPGDEGHDEITSAQNGNQIAYELIKLGYTVLFKKFSNTSDLDSADFWEPLKDKANYDFRYITTGGYFGKNAAAQIAKLATFKNKPASGDDYLDNADEYAKAGRGDCLALIDVDEEDTDIQGQTTQAGILAGIQKYTNKITDNGTDVLTKECKILVPQVIFDYVNPKYRQDSTQTTTTLPASFHYLACANKAFNEYNEWYAVAGYQRGICDLKVAGTTITLGDYAVNVLQPRKASKIGNSATNDFIHAVNPVIKVRKAYYLWGNRTAAPLLEADTTVGSKADLKASHFTNIRQLCITLKKQLYVACRKFTFDPNSDILWVNFCNVIRPTLEKMKADQGITDYKFIKVKNKRKALLTAKIRIVPIEAVEDFDISIYLEDSISGVTVSAEEVND